MIAFVVGIGERSVAMVLRFITKAGSDRTAQVNVQHVLGDPMTEVRKELEWLTEPTP